MNRGLIIILVVACLLTAFFVFKKIQKSQFKIGDTLFWLFFCLLLLCMSIFPNAVSAISHFLGFESPANFVFVAIIFLLLTKTFSLDLRAAKLEEKITKMAQTYAIEKKED